MTTTDRNRTAIGRTAEEMAAEFLVAEGFRILWRNVRIGSLEIDLVAQRDDLAIIVEVRKRGDAAFEGPLASVGIKKRRMLLRASRGIWRGRLKKMPDIQRVRIDVIGIHSHSFPDPTANVDTTIEWIKGAFSEHDV